MTPFSPRRSGDSDVRFIDPASDEFTEVMQLTFDAYPAFSPPHDAAAEAQLRREMIAADPTYGWCGAYRDGKLAGVMRLHDFMMNVRGAQVFAGGVGGVAVRLDMKRRGIARDLILAYLAHYRETGAALAILHPFRPDFYRAFGFGYGAKMERYRFSLGALRESPERLRVERLGVAHAQEAAAAYARVQAVTNGLLEKPAYVLSRMLAEPGVFTFGYRDEGGVLRGYLAYGVSVGEAGTLNTNDMVARDLVFDEPKSLAGLLAFARSQRDQFAHLILATQVPDFHLVATDPRRGDDAVLAPPGYHAIGDSGLGVMYRILDGGTPFAGLRDVRFGTLDATVRFELSDDIVPGSAQAATFTFEGGRARPADRAPDATLTIGIADLTSVVVGSVRLRSLVEFGLAEVRGSLDPLDAAFATAPPQCMTRF